MDKEKIIENLRPAPLNFEIKLYDVIQVRKAIDLTLEEVEKAIDGVCEEIGVDADKGNIKMFVRDYSQGELEKLRLRLTGGQSNG